MKYEKYKNMKTLMCNLCFHLCLVIQSTGKQDKSNTFSDLMMKIKHIFHKDDSYPLTYLSG